MCQEVLNRGALYVIYRLTNQQPWTKTIELKAPRHLALGSAANFKFQLVWCVTLICTIMYD